MEIIPQLISRYSIVLYAVCGIACAYFLFTGVASLRELKRAVFRLERNSVVTRAVSSLVKALLCVLISGAIFAVVAMAPAQPEGLLLGDATGTPSGIVIPTSMPTAAITSGEATAGANFTPTVTYVDAAGAVTATADTGQAAQSATLEVAEPAPTPAPEPTATLPPQTVLSPDLIADCSSPNALITNPGQGENVAGAYAVRGTAIVEAGGYYKLEIQSADGAQWAFLGRGDATVNGGVLLDGFNAGSFAPGAYPFRLVVVGADGGIRAVCRIPIFIGS